MDAGRDSLLVAVHQQGNTYGIASLDMASGRFLVLEVQGLEAVLAELQRLDPAELLISDDLTTSEIERQCRGVRRRAPWEFELDTARRLLSQQFGSLALACVGCDHFHSVLSAAGCLLS